MARQYNIKKFFRAAPNVLLASYFKKRKALADFDFKTLKEGNPDPLVAAWLELPDKQRAKMEAQFQEIYALSCQQGVKAITDEARYWIEKVDGEPFEPFMDWIAGLKNDADRAFQTFLKYPKYWKGATNFFHADSLSWWRKRKGLPKVAAQCDDDSLDKLSDKIIHYYHYEEGKGTNCTVEPFRRNDLDYFFAYPEDYSQRGIEWVKDEIKPRPHNPIFEVIFVYSKTYGTLDINYKGDRKALKHLQRFFCEAILKAELPPEPKDTRVYELNPLLEGFTPQFDPSSGIEEVHVTKMRLSSCLKQGDRINLEADSEENPNAVYELKEKVAKGLPMKYFNVSRIDFHASVVVDVSKPPIPVKFHVTHPNSCNLKYDDAGRLLREMLKKSKIERKEPEGEEDND